MEEINNTDNIDNIDNISEQIITDAKKTIKCVDKITDGSIPGLNKVAKIIKYDEILNKYNKNLNNTNSHTKSIIITSSQEISKKTTQFVPAMEMATIIASSGGYTPYSIACGAITGTIVYLANEKLSEDVSNLVGKTITKTLELTSEYKNKLPEYVKNTIFEYVSNPIEQSLSSIYTSSREIINNVKQTVTKIICDNYKKMKPSETIIYCNDINKNNIEINLDKIIVTKILNCCNISNYDSDFNLLFNNYSISTYVDKNFSEKINLKNTFEKSPKLNLENIQDINYEIPKCQLLPIYKPNTSLISKPITTHIPDYNVSCSMKGGGGFGNCGFIGVVVIAVQFSFVF
jgi:hypothetical protein